MRKLRIAMLAPLKRAITPDVTASRPRVMVDLIQKILTTGHDVTIFGTGDSVLPGVKIIPVIPKALNELPVAENPFYQHTAALTKQVAQLVARQDDFDIIHNHMYPEYYPFPALSSLHIPLVTTIHSQMTADMKDVLSLYPHLPLATISKSASQESGLPLRVIYNGINTDVFTFLEDPSREYFLFVGRMSKAVDATGEFIDPKGVKNAIAVAKKTGMHLKIVGNVENPSFYTLHVKPYLSKNIEFVGEVSSEQTIARKDMVSLFQHAIALLNPINWEEPFGLVMAEAMSCGTPVIAFDRGSVSELIVDGKTGFIVDPIVDEKHHHIITTSGIDGLVEAVGQIQTLDRTACRDHVIAHFSTDAMATRYMEWYEEELAKFTK